MDVNNKNMVKSSPQLTSSYSRFSNTNKEPRGNYSHAISSAIASMSTSFNNKVSEGNSYGSISTTSPVLYKIDSAEISGEIPSNNNENSNRTSQATTYKSASLISVNAKQDINNGARHSEYVKQRPNKLVRADLFKDQKKTRLNSPVVTANGFSKVFKSQIVNKQCAYFNKYGHCKDGDWCSYKHSPNHVEICKKWLKGAECPGKKCFRQHILSAHVIPHCSHFAKGMCLKGSECRYTHVKVSKRADYCKEFMVGGFCDAGKNCRKKHGWGKYEAS